MYKLLRGVACCQHAANSGVNGNILTTQQIGRRLLSTATGHADPADEKVLRRRKFQPQDAIEPNEKPAGQLPGHSRVVICGGGITGASVAYHMGLQGWGSETLLIEQDAVGGDLPWSACGLAGRFEPSYTELKLSEYSIDLIKQLTQRGLPTGWRQVGSLNLARNFDRMTSFHRMKSQAVAWGMNCEILTPEQCQQHCSLISLEGIEGGLWIPEDGVCDPHLVCKAFIEEARRLGVRIVEHCAVKKSTVRTARSQAWKRLPVTWTASTL